MVPARRIVTHDILILADFTRGGDAGFRIAQEIRLLDGLGLDIGLLHLKVNSPGLVVSPDVQQCVRDGLATVTTAQPDTHVRLALVYSPSTLLAPVQDLSWLRADKVVLIHDRVPDPRQVGSWFSFQFGPVTWAPTNRWVRAGLMGLNTPVPLLDEDWRPVARPLPRFGNERRDPHQTVFGRVSVNGGPQWPTTVEEIAETYPMGSGRDFRIIGRPPAKLWQEVRADPAIEEFQPADISVERFLSWLDVFFYYTSNPTPALPEAAIAAMMASGKLVLLPPHLEAHFGPGAIYAKATDALSCVEDLSRDSAALAVARDKAVANAGYQFSEQSFVTRVSSLLQTEDKKRKTVRRAQSKKRALFVPSNGIGVGHVTRMLAIARRLDTELEPVFATIAQAAQVVESFGYRAEYIPSQGDTQTDRGLWDEWFHYQLGELIDIYGPSVVVFDGNNPTPGLVKAVTSRGRCHLAWVRRGMVGQIASPYLENARFMDLIIEPGEIAGERDTGPTAARKPEALQVDPITLLDPQEALDKEAARAKLDLSLEAPAVLIQLGAGANRDIAGLTDEIIQQLQRFPNLQIVVAEWENSAVELRNWPHVRVVKGFPLAGYFNAFDFSISAAGYNTFHDLITAGIPTIFVANRSPEMDDQGARAQFAQDLGIGFDLPEEQLFHLPALCEALLNETANSYIREQCKMLSRSNGAAAAANAIVRLVRST